MYVYRDIEGQPDDPAAVASAPDEHDASYWYDLPGTAARGDTTPGVPQETRGPFEPLVSSAVPPGTTPRFSASGEANVDKHFDHLLAQQRELISEYFKQSSAAKPAVGPADQAAAEPVSAAGQEPGHPGNAAPAGGPAGTAEGARVTADQPRAW